MNEKRRTQTNAIALEKIPDKIREQTVSKSVRSYRSLALQSYLTVVVVVFSVLAFFARLIPYFPIDLLITRSIQSFHPMWFDALMRSITFIGNAPQVDILVVLIAGFLFAVGLRWEAVVSVINAVSITLVGLVIKEIIHRPRPSIDVVHVFSHLKEYSFPSGHVLFFTAFFGFLWFLSYTLLRFSKGRTFLLVLFPVLLLLVGPSRVYLGAHWASDVIGAYLFGSIWLVFIIWIYQAGKKRFFVHQPTAPEKKDTMKQTAILTIARLLICYGLLVVLSIGLGYLIQVVPVIKEFDAFLYLHVNGLPHPKFITNSISPFDLWFFPYRKIFILPAYFYLIIGGFLLALFFLQRDNVAWALCSLVLGFILAAVLLQIDWHFVFRHRPFESLPSPIDHVSRRILMQFPSYPSGHVRDTTLLATIIAKFFPGIFWLLFLFVFFIAFTRIYTGAHYPTDVFAGILFGYVIAKISLAITENSSMFVKRKTVRKDTNAIS